MRSIPVMKRENANISIDFLAASAVLLLAFLFTITTVFNMVTPYSGYTKELHPAADRAITLLMEDEGKWKGPNGGGTNWELVWLNDSYSYVERIGFSESKHSNTIDYGKVRIFMDSPGDYWEYPTNGTDSSELDYASRALGIDRYHFYLQIRPLNGFDEGAANHAAHQMVGDRGDVVLVVRHSILYKRDFGDFDGMYVTGFQDPAKPLFGLTQDNFSFIIDQLEFTISNWSITGQNACIINIALDESIKKVQTRVDKNQFLTPDQFSVMKNGIYYTDIQPNGNMRLYIQNSNVTTTFIIPVSTLEEYFGEDWKTSVEIIYIMLNVQNIDVYDTGVTWFGDNIETSFYPIKIMLWVW